MPKVNLPGLHGGISQQTPNLRLQNQHQGSLNVIFDVIDGAKVRWPTRYVCDHAGATLGYYLGSIKTTDGKLWMVYHKESTNVLSLVCDDPLVPIKTISGAAYLNGQSDYIKMYPILDTITVVNTDIPVSRLLTSITGGGTLSAGFIHVPQVYAGASATISLEVTTTKAGVLGAGVDLVSATYSHTMTSEETVGNLRSLIGTNLFGSSASSALLVGNMMTVRPAGMKVTHGGNTYGCSNTHTSGASTEPGTGASWNTVWSLVGETPADNTGIVAWTSGRIYADAEDVAAMNPVVTITSYSDFAITCSSSKLALVDPETPQVFYVNTIEAYEKLPAAAPYGGTIFEVTEGYYVRYDNVSGSYLECACPGHEAYMDKTTMPHELRYDSSTIAWTFGTVDAYDTAVRNIGDSTSAPLPDFVGRKISAVFFYRNRLCFLSDNYVSMSRVGDFYRHFPDTATEVLDSDPISVTPASKEYSPLTWAIPYNKTLLLVGPEKQYVLHSGYDALSPTTVAIDEATSYRLLPKMEPLLLESSLILFLDQGEYTGLLEYRVSDQEIATEGHLLTSNIPTLIPSDVTNALYLQSEHMILLYSQGDIDVYSYKFHKNEQGQLMQSAWGILGFNSSTYGIASVSESQLMIQTTILLSMNTDEDVLRVPALEELKELNATSASVIPEGQIMVNRTSGKQVFPEDLEGTVAVWQGFPITWYLELSPMILRDSNGLPRSDVRTTIRNLQIDWSGGDFLVQTYGPGLPVRSTSVVPTSYTMLTIEAGESLVEPQPTRILVMAPSKRVSIKIMDNGFNHVKLHNVSFNIDIVKDRG